MIVEFVDNSVRESYNGTSKLIAPLALTIFVWIFLMNLMDLIPVDFIPYSAQLIGGAMGHDPHYVYFKIVPSTDPNITLGMAFCIFSLSLVLVLNTKAWVVLLVNLRYTHLVQKTLCYKPCLSL